MNLLYSVYLVRQTESVSSVTVQHTGLTDFGQNALALGEQLSRPNFDRVFGGPLQSARRPCELTGFGAEADFDRDLLEWNYGEYEGPTLQKFITEPSPELSERG
jgi:broad specificity phosphatase PhoE